MTVNIYLRENLAAVSSKSIIIAPAIDESKLNNAVKAFGYKGNPSNVIAVFDNTVFGSAKDGLLFTGEQVIYRASFSDPIQISYESIDAVKYVQNLTGSKQDILEHSVVVVCKDATMVVIKNLSDCNYTVLAAVLQGIISEFNEFKEEKQLIPLEEMQESVKVAYLKAIVNMAYDNDQVIDNNEFAEIMLLMTRLSLSTESRFILRVYMAGAEQIAPLETLFIEIDNECPAGQIRSLHISLAKDLLNLYFCTGGLSIANFAFLQKNRSLLKVTDDEIDLAVLAIRNDHNMLKEDVTDDQVIVALKLLSAKAAAVGTPLAAVYLSGSVVGMSAAGLTSGLATLGMGGMLGLSSMATGIGVAVLLGVGAYTGIRKMTGANELTRAKRRELMLNEVIRQTQITISLLIQDINYITGRLNKAIQSHNAQDKQVKKLMAFLSQMTGAGTVLTGKSNDAEISVTKLRCARVLDCDKLKILTKDPTKIELYKFIRNSYEERTVILEKDGEKIEAIELIIRSSLSTKDLSNLAKAFDVIGYFKMGEVITGAVTDAAGKTMGKLTNLFS